VSSSGAEVLLTPRLRMLPCDAVVARAAVEAPETLSSLLGLRVDPEWPSEDLVEVLPGYADALEGDPSLLRWGFFLVLDRSGRRLVGDAGFKGPPDEDGAVEIGYGIVSPFRGRGYATEAVRALVAYARRQSEVREVRATCYSSNAPSRRVLEKSGFRHVGTEGALLDWSLTIR
jgi:[ribosomal protein S5]-alanine N-acetyltransferase